MLYGMIVNKKGKTLYVKWFKNPMCLEKYNIKTKRGMKALYACIATELNLTRRSNDELRP